MSSSSVAEQLENKGHWLKSLLLRLAEARVESE